MKALIVKEDGLIYVGEVPEKPKFVDTMEAVENCLNDKAMADWRKAIKDSAILVSDQEKAREAINKHSIMGLGKFVELKPGIYPIPDLKWEKEYQHRPYDTEPWRATNPYYYNEPNLRHKRIVALLTPSLPSEKEDNTEKHMKTRHELIERLEKLLSIEYENDVFTWHQIKEAILKVTGPYDRNPSITLQEFDRLHPEFLPSKGEQEKQEELWAELLKTMCFFPAPKYLVEVKEQFTITRKQ